MTNLLKSNKQAVLTAFLTPVETFILGAVLAVAEGVQLNVSMNPRIHYALSAGILVLGVLVKPLTPTQFLAKIPTQIVVLVQGVIGAVVILAQGWSLGSVGLTVLGVVLVAANTLGLGPPGPVALPAAKAPVGGHRRKP